MDIQETLEMGINAHKDGKIEDAKRFYKAILKVDPNHADANHNLGVLNIGLGNERAALDLFDVALNSNPSVEQFWVSKIKTLIKLHEFDEARNLIANADLKNETTKQLEIFAGQMEQAGKITDPPNEKLSAILENYTRKQFQIVLKSIETLEKDYPSSPILLNISGAAYSGLKQYDLAIKCYERALEIKPDFAEAFNNLGVALKTIGKLREAKHNFQKAVALQAGYCEAINNLGTTLKSMGDLDAAELHYKRAIEINPQNANALNNLGNTYFRRGEHSAAIELYKRSLAINPKHAEAHNNMGSCYYKQGEISTAIKYYRNALKLNLNYLEAFHNFGVVLSKIRFTQADKGLFEDIEKLLDFETIIRPSKISKAVISALKCDKEIANLCLNSREALSTETLNATISALLKFGVLSKLMSVTIIDDLEFEQLFKQLRRLITSATISGTLKAEFQAFQIALAHQCFNNEYIYFCTNEEKSKIEKLESIVTDHLSNGKQPCVTHILCLASYRSLFDYKWHNKISKIREIETIYTRQVLEVLEENKLKQGIKSLNYVKNNTSQKVQRQYEENPYPRWINTYIPPSTTTVEAIVSKNKLQVDLQKNRSLLNPHILIAGCGTGQHSINVAAKFENSRVLAIDLSMASLAFAKRKTIELGLVNLDYKQADILNLKASNNEYDIIESVGVLHHMADPYEGWQILSNCLKPGGLMKIGLYSKIARKQLNIIREKIMNAGISNDRDNIITFRNELIETNDLNNQILSSSDFYSVSTIRDLLFHVQEKQFDLTEIKKYLEKMNLTFCGFENEDARFLFENVITSDTELYDLDKWALFELEYPNAFAEMYQFWCQKSA